MHIMPTTKQEWGRFVIFPFKAYIIVAFPCFLLFDHTHDSLLSRYANTADTVAIAYLISGILLIIAGMIQKFVLKSRAASSSFVFAGIAVFICLVLIPMLAPL
jgi:hypothetical protein